MSPSKNQISPSLEEVHRSVPVPTDAGFWRKLMAFSGPGYLVAVGYMDPGNWATDIAGGSAFGYTLLSVILLSNIMAIMLQALCARLGIASDMDLAQACRQHYSKPVNFSLWLLCEFAICACDLAEIIGTAIALQLLFGLPLTAGICLTVLDTFLILMLQAKGFRYLEAFILALMILIALCFGVQLFLSQPDLSAVLSGYIPSTDIIKNPDMLFIAIGILGATVMPHNLYLHSSIVQTRAYGLSPENKKEALKFATIDSTLALSIALFINSAILILSASVFYKAGLFEVAEIQDAHKLLTPLLGTSLASFLFALALLASGQNSTVTATLAGQIAMEGFLHIRLPAWLRRLITRLIAIIPALLVSIYYGESGTAKLLVLSQVILSMQLPFAVVPLIQFTRNKKIMGTFAIGNKLLFLYGFIAAVIIMLNLKLLLDFFVF